MNEFRDRNPGFGAGKVLVAGLVAIVALVLVVVFLKASGLRGIAIALGVVPLFALLQWAVFPALRWWGVDLTIGAAGIGFGAGQPSATAAYRGPGFATRYPLLVPWSAVRTAALVGPDGAAQLIATAKQGVSAGQVSRLWGFFPSPAAAHHLLLTVDTAQVTLPPPSVRLGMGAVNLEPSTAWALPVRDVEGLRRAFDGAPVPLLATAG